MNLNKKQLVLLIVCSPITVPLMTLAFLISLCKDSYIAGILLYDKLANFVSE